MAKVRRGRCGTQEPHPPHQWDAGWATLQCPGTYTTTPPPDQQEHTA